MSHTGASREVRHEIRIAASPSTVFALLTEPRQMMKWFATLVEADAQPGGVFRITEPGRRAIEGVYLEVIGTERSSLHGVAWRG